MPNTLSHTLIPFISCIVLPSIHTAGEGAAGETAEQALVTIGDKGRAQLQRIAAEKIKLSLSETYKDRVTFSQVRNVYTEGWGVCMGGGEALCWWCVCIDIEHRT